MMTPLQIVQDPHLLDKVIEVMRERNLFDDYYLTPLQIVQDPHLLDKVIEVMCERNLFDEYHLIPERILHNADILAMNRLEDETSLEKMDDAQLAADYGLQRIPEPPDRETLHGLTSPWLAEHVALTRRRVMRS